MSSQSVSSLPEFIHIGGRQQSKGVSCDAATPKTKACQSPPDSSACSPAAPVNNLFKTPTKGSSSNTSSSSARRRIRGILKSPSYKFTGIKLKSSSPKKSKQSSKQVASRQQQQDEEPSTPTTVGTNESFDDSDSISRASSCGSSISRASSCGSSTIGSIGSFGTTSSEGIKKVIDKIINNDNNNNTTPSSSPTKSKGCGTDEQEKTKSLLNRSLSSSTSVSSSSTTSTTASTNSSTPKEELQRRFRIKHIEDLNERISEAKARKLVERKAMRREDKLLLKLARQMKTLAKRSRENAVNITILEESNQFCEELYNRAQEELKELKASRALLEECLHAERETKLAADREQRDRILRVQNAELEAHKRSHQYNCMELCEAVLEANKDLERMQALWDEHLGDGTTTTTSRNLSNNVLSKRPRKKSRASLWVVMAVVLAMTVMVILTATAGGNDRNTATNPSFPVEHPQPQQFEEHRSLPPQNFVHSGIIRDTSSSSHYDYVAGPPTTSSSSRKATTVNSKNSTVFSELPLTNSNHETDSPRKANTAPEEMELTSPEPETTSFHYDDFTTETASTSIPSSKTESITTTLKGKGKRRFKPKEAISRLFGR